jgi:hypothetical protein
MGIVPLDKPVAAPFAVRMNTDLAHARVAHGRIVEALAIREPGDARRMERVPEIGGDNFLEGSRPRGDALSPTSPRRCLRSLSALLHDFDFASVRRRAFSATCSYSLAM